METYFKVLKAIEGPERPFKTHNLLALFNDLSDDSKEMLEAFWFFTYAERFEFYEHVLASGDPELVEAFKPPTLLNAMTEAQMAFVSLRYVDGVVDKDNALTGFQAWALPDFLRARILDIRPDLKPPPGSFYAGLNAEPGKPQVAKGHYNQPRITITYS